MKHVSLTAAAFAVALSAVAAEAAPVEYTITTGDASGTLDGQIFGAANVVFKLYGDTADVVTPSGFQQILMLLVTVQIDSNPLLTVVSPDLGLFSNTLGFGMWRYEDADLLTTGPTGIDLTLASPAVPISWDYLQWGFAPTIMTDGGVLDFDNANGISGTYSAIVEESEVPLPAAGWLLIAGLGGVAALRRRAG